MNKNDAGIYNNNKTPKNKPTEQTKQTKTSPLPPLSLGGNPGGVFSFFRVDAPPHMTEPETPSERSPMQGRHQKQTNFPPSPPSRALNQSSIFPAGRENRVQTTRPREIFFRAGRRKTSLYCQKSVTLAVWCGT